MKMKIGPVYIYLTRHRLKGHDKWDRLRRNSRNKINRSKKRLYAMTGGVCAVCKRHFPIRKLQVHHLKPVSKFPWLVANKDNMELLCEECHKAVHKDNKDNN